MNLKSILKKNYDLLENILHYGLLEKMNIIFKRSETNKEYTNALNMLQNRNNTFRQGYTTTRRSDSDFCDFCVKLWCLDSMCECCCDSDIISCC
ncbi:hypothetical protein Z968_01140 [Clostridium novyi A str. 4552]|uniref:Uncharacterized protein n=1 Tax=Clostridium novyi A str. 4552 TaxID=1444289 RepID=A0A0A0ICM0_CLONO|nr:hypothetical protein [Clostridium novyi]KGM98111.1 hypothetical protein Z968_01140 [Clostridium novyi A str. 4552]